MKKIYLYVFAALLFSGVLFGWLVPASGKGSFQKELGTLSTVAGLVETTYVQELPSDRLFRGAVNGLLKTLDPYSLYLDPKAYEEFKADNDGRFVGTGMEVSVKGGVLHVISPLDGSPAAEAGLRPGDVIAKIEGVATKDMALSDAVQRLRGEPKSWVALTVVRDEEPKPLEIKVERRAVEVKGVREAKKIEEGIIYIRIAEFQKHTAEDFEEAAHSLGLQNGQGLVIDLRNNPGGLLDAAVKVAENFIPKGQVILSTRGRVPKKSRLFVSHNANPFKPGPIAVLVNRGSASGSEILTGALQDHGLARVFGRKTYGKGCVQTLTPLPDGSAVRITTSLYYTPKGRLIHEIGLTPDEEIIEDPKSGEDKALVAALTWIRRTPSGGGMLAGQPQNEGSNVPPRDGVR